MMEPEVRFMGFEGEWERKSFGEVAELRRGLTYTPSNICKNGVRVLRSSNINEDTFVHSEDDVFVEESCVNIPKVKPGDILITAANGSPRLVGKHTIIPEDLENAVHGGFMILATPLYDSGFLNASMSSNWYGKFLKVGVSGGNGALGNLSKNTLENFIFPLPSLPEQRAISSYFRSLDASIVATERRLEKLRAVKAASLQKMFPAEGQSVPEVRFKGFEGEWERKVLGELYTRSSEKNDLTFRSDKIISVANMYFAPVDAYAKENEEYLKTYYVMRLGDIAFEGHRNKNFRYGRFVENTIGDGIVSHVFVVLTPIAPYDLYFWKYYINNERVMRSILAKCTKASTMMHEIVVDDFLKQSILTPSLPEQRAISSYFRSLDASIVATERRLEKLRAVKAASLQKMFA